MIGVEGFLEVKLYRWVEGEKELKADGDNRVKN
jgi:hypothetical protein